MHLIYVVIHTSNTLAQIQITTPHDHRASYMTGGVQRKEFRSVHTFYGVNILFESYFARKLLVKAKFMPNAVRLFMLHGNYMQRPPTNKV